MTTHYLTDRTVIECDHPDGCDLTLTLREHPHPDPLEVTYIHPDDYQVFRDWYIQLAWVLGQPTRHYCPTHSEHPRRQDEFMTALRRNGRAQ